MIEEAFLFANETHLKQKRKDGHAYIVHPVTVALELARNGADENLICAGLLHDTIEDGHVNKETLKELFNDAIADLVAIDSEDKSLSWEERKTKVINDVAKGSKAYKMLICADKLSNLRDVKNDYDKNGELAWARFNRGKDKQAWFYRNLLISLKDLAGMPMYQSLVVLVNELFKEGETK